MSKLISVLAFSRPSKRCHDQNISADESWPELGSRGPSARFSLQGGAARAIVIITVINMIITSIPFQVEQLTSRPDNLGLSGPRKAQSGKEERRRNNLVNKSQISSPCGFRHNVSVRAPTQTQKIVFKNKQLSKPVHGVISSNHSRSR